MSEKVMAFFGRVQMPAAPKVCRRSFGHGSECPDCGEKKEPCAACLSGMDRRRRESSWRAQGIKDCTVEKFDELMLLQGGACAGCGKSHDEQPLFVDHDHKSGLTRGLLCPRCNAAIGCVQDEPGALRRLADYLENSTKLALKRDGAVGPLASGPVVGQSNGP